MARRQSDNIRAGADGESQPQPRVAYYELHGRTSTVTHWYMVSCARSYHAYMPYYRHQPTARPRPPHSDGLGGTGLE